MRNAIIIMFLLLATTASAEDGWFPYSFPADPTKAPDYNNHFYFADGARARFWGANRCFDACFPNKKQAEIMANALPFSASTLLEYYSTAGIPTLKIKYVLLTLR